MPAAEPGEGPDPAALFDRWKGEGTLALAVSGGADSLALMLLAARWRAELADGPRLVVFSVDHGLRPEAAGEVAMVGAAAARLGLAFRPLKATGFAPSADIEAAARTMRYRLLFEAARAEGAGVIMTAHHADDQAETLLLRLARGSGVYGLAAMAAESERDGLRLARPLLLMRRADLVRIVADAGLSPAADPHNADRRFARARLRSLMPALATEGLDTPTLAATAARLRRAAAAIDDYADRVLRAATVDATGALRLDAGLYAREPEETRLRVLARILRAVGGADYTPRLDSLMPLAALLTEGEGPVPARTLAGVAIDRRKGQLRFQREAGRTGLPEIGVSGGYAGLWDGRFRVEISPAEAPLRLGALGEAGRRALAACLPDGLPRAIAATPALFRGETLIAAPPLGLAAGPEHGVTLSIEVIVADRLAERIPAEAS